MFRLSRACQTAMKVLLVVFAISLSALMAVVSAAEREIATSRAARKVAFLGILAGPDDLRRKPAEDDPVKVGADPCHARTTDDRNTCDKVVDIIAGAARDDRAEAVTMGAPRTVLTDSAGRVLVADSSVPGIHVF